VCLFYVRAARVSKSRVLEAPKGQRTPGEEGYPVFWLGF
jgi:hypothetical protein